MIGLVDCNNFFVSCERSVDPSLCGRAVVVLSNNDGCVVSRSNEAKHKGVRMGQPAFEIRNKIVSGDIIALSGNHLLYRDISLRVHDIFRRYAPHTIDYSIDEAFLDMRGINQALLEEIGYSMVRSCMEELKIPVTVGFAMTKTLAKLVTDRCKKESCSVGILYGEDEVWQLLQRTPISDLWGIGRRLTRRLYESGIYTVSQFAAKDVCWVRAKFGVTVERSWRELHELPCIELEHVEKLLQDSVSETRTFPEDINDYDYVRARISIYAAHCAKKLRAMRGLSRRLTVMLRSNRFHTTKGYFHPEISLDFGQPTSDTNVIVRAAISGLDLIFSSDIAYKRAGVILSEIVPDIPRTPSLFEPIEEDNVSSKKLMETIDNINRLVGQESIKLASNIVNPHSSHNDGYSSSFGAPFDPSKKKIYKSPYSE